MKPKPGKKIDKLLGELGLHPHSRDLDVSTAESFSPAVVVRLIGPCGKSCYGSEATARKAATRIKSRGANTSFFRTYFCPDCKSWHLTSAKNHGPGHSTAPIRNAGRNRRNHHQTQPSDES